LILIAKQKHYTTLRSAHIFVSNRTSKDRDRGRCKGNQLLSA